MQKTTIDLRPLELSDREKVCDFLGRYPPQVSELTFTNLYVWRRMRQVLVAEVDGSLLFVAERDGERKLLGPPVGELPLEQLPDLLHEAGIPCGERLDAATAEGMRSLGLPVARDRDNSDYVYLREDLAELSGRKFHRKKNMVNRCLNSYDCQYEPITLAIIDETLAMQERWGRGRDCREDPALCAESHAIEEAMTRFDEFGLLGGAVRIDGRIEAFTLGERLNGDTAVVHFEKAMTQYQGLYQLINQSFCQHGLGEFKFVNREQDLGVPGLRKAKRSYQPHHMVDKFVACWESEMAPCSCVLLHGRCAEHGIDKGGDHA